MKKRKLLALCLVPALLAGCAAPAGVTDLSRQFEAGAPAPPEADPAAAAAMASSDKVPSWRYRRNSPVRAASPPMTATAR